MVRFRLIFSVILLFLPAYLCGCGCPDRLAWQLKQGDTYSVKVHLISDLSMIFGGVDHKDSEMRLNCRVKEADSRQILVEATITSVKASMSSLGKKFSFDSNQAPTAKPKKKSKTEQQQTFTNAFAGLKGKKFTVRMDSRQGTTKLVKMDPLIKKAAYAGAGGSMIGGDQVNMLLAEGNLREYVTGGLMIGSDAEPVQQNVKWKGRGSVLVPYAPVTATVKSYAVESIKEQRDKKVAVIKYDVTREQASVVSAKPHKPTKPGKPRRPRKRTSKSTFNVDHIKGQGNLTFSLDNGRPIKLTEKTRVFVSSRTRSRKPASVKPGSKKAKAKIFYTIQKTIEYMDN
ncbi:MAG: hypothetical protein KAJ46_04545 [Sedimentisphaerales bacterium]|nr:hypothetical protein [Sedimentisphaerales bacterium]